METNGVEQRAKIFASLSDPTRLRIVELLAGNGEMTGTDIAAELGISLALHCHHTKILSEAGVITKRKEGQTTYCSLNRTAVKRTFKSLG